MKTLTATSAALGLALVLGQSLVRGGLAVDPAAGVAGASRMHPAPADLTPAELTAVVQKTCLVCHNNRTLTGNLSLEGFDVAAAAQKPVIAEKMIHKLRAGMMPPRLAPYRPGADTLEALVATLESVMDRAARANPNPGDRTFQRLNRAEYEQSVREVLALDVNAGNYLPLDTKSENFDNIADVQMLSPTLLDAFLNAAAEVSRLAVGDADASFAEITYSGSGYASQWNRVEGAPFGTRGGMSIVHNFPADGEYVFKVEFEHTTTGEGYAGQIAPFEQLEFSVNGEPVALLEVDQWLTYGDPDMITMRTVPVFVRSGPQRITAAFVKKTEGPIEDLLSPHDWSLADRHTGQGGYGLTLLPHVRDLIIGGPTNPSGVSDTPSRRKIFSCRPTSASEEDACAREILSRLGSEAYRRPLAARDLDGLMRFFADGAAVGGFEGGIRMALQAVLASPHFVFRFEEPPEGVKPGEIYPINDSDLASRLAFFLWGTPPDAELMDLARRGRLADRGTMEAQVRRMLADPRSEALATRFAGQWLRLQDLDKVHPDTYWFPDFDQQLADAMRRETELFFHSLVSEDKSFLDFYTADYTFVNERLARHYGIRGVTGSNFRRVPYPDETRRGILGQGSVLVLTSLANRTSPVLRGKWVMEVLLGTPPPPPPPGIPDLEVTKGSSGGRQITTRERMENHRANPVCSACHQFMDPIGLALDNFDVTGRWRIRENGAELDTRGEFYDGTRVESPQDLRDALLRRPAPLLRTFTENLMAYALGRRVEHYDKATVRAIVSEAEKNDYRMSSFIMGVVNSDPFRMKRAPAVVEQAEDR